MNIAGRFTAPLDLYPPAFGATKLENGLAYQVLKKGDGRKPGLQSECVVHYKGWRSKDGELFDRLADGLVTVRTLMDAVHFSVVCVLSMSTGPFYSMQASSAGGKMTVCALMVFGMVFGAMPIAIVGSCFSNTWFDKDRIMLLAHVRGRLNAQGYTPEDVRDVFDEVDVDGSGEIEFGEFKKMLRTFNLRTVNGAKSRRLFHYFDNDGDGTVSFTDFAFDAFCIFQRTSLRCRIKA